jgi:uncharacterized RDD family membrane protein YckC
MTTVQQPDPFLTAPPSPGGPPGPRAGFWQRFGAAVLDGLIINACSLPFIFINGGLYLAVYLLGQIAYFTVLEGGPKGQTFGKMAFGIRVVDLARGGPIGYSRGFIRWIGRIVSSFVLLIGYLWMLWDKEKQTWHDKMAGAIVVPVRSYPIA